LKQLENIDKNREYRHINLYKDDSVKRIGTDDEFSISFNVGYPVAKK